MGFFSKSAKSAPVQRAAAAKKALDSAVEAEIMSDPKAAKKAGQAMSEFTRAYRALSPAEQDQVLPGRHG